MSAMEVDHVADPGVEERKGEDHTISAGASAHRTPKGNGEGDRNVMLHPVRFPGGTFRILVYCLG